VVLDGALQSFEKLLAERRRFACIYADPRRLNEITTVEGGKTISAPNLEQLFALPIRELAEDEAHLHLWVGNDWLFDALRVMESWGFEFRSILVWVKPQRGPGDYWRLSHELLLLGVRGELGFRDQGVMSWVRANRLPHGRKPERIRKLIERVSPGPYLELFARSPVKGWTVVGSDCGSSIIITDGEARSRNSTRDLSTPHFELDR
jgi:N6-adenosine-specific RNA methylase IME4